MFQIAKQTAAAVALATVLAGSTLATDWTDEALTLQAQLDRDLPLTEALWIGTHNSYNARNWDDAYEIDPNQTYSPKDQLRKGVRELTYDVWDYGNTLRLCHAGCNAFGTEKKFRRGLEQIADFIEEGNEDAVILLKIEAEGFFGQIATQLEAELGDYIYKPTEGQVSIDTSCSDRHGLEPEFLSKRDVLEAGKNVLVIYAAGDLHSCPSSSDYLEWVHVGLEYQGSGWQQAFDKPSDTGDCEAMYADNSMTRIHDPNTWLIDEQKFTNSNIDDYLACGLNVIELFNFDDDDALLHDEVNPVNLVWSWANGQPDGGATEDCAYMNTDGRFHDGQCAEAKPFACYSDFANTWNVTTAEGVWSEGFATCASEYPGTAFAVPQTARRSDALHDEISVDTWVNYHDRSIEGTWEPNGQGKTTLRTIGPFGPGGGDSTFDDYEEWELAVQSGIYPRVTRVAMSKVSNASLVIHLESDDTDGLSGDLYDFIYLDNDEHVSEYKVCYDSQGVTYMKLTTSYDQSLSWGSTTGTCSSGRFSGGYLGVYATVDFLSMTSLGFYTADDYRASVDNDEVATAGDWYSSSHTAGYEGDDYYYLPPNEVGVMLASIEVQDPGYYNLYARWTAASNRSTAVTYQIGNGSSTNEVTVDQTQNGGRDVLLGTHYFGTTSNSDPTSASFGIAGSFNGYVIVDSFRVERVRGQDMVAINYTGSGQGDTLYELGAGDAGSEDIASVSGDDTCVSDLDFQPGTGVLYAIDCDGYQNSGGTLLTLDRHTGVATEVGSLHGDRTAATAIAFHPRKPNVLYAINRSGSGWGKVLYTIDVGSGETTEIGTLWGDRTHATSIDFDSEGNLYAINNSYTGGSGQVLYTIDISTAETTEVGTLSGDRTHATSIRFGINDVLYAINWQDYQGTGAVLYTISTSNAFTTDVATAAGDRTHATALAIRVE